MKLAELSNNVREFLDQSLGFGGVVIEVDDGREFARVMPLRRTTTDERATTWRRLQEIQQKVGAKMRARGETEADLDRILQEDT